MAREDHTLQARMSAFLRSHSDGDAACRLAQDIDCDPRTAKNLLDKHWPSARHMRGIVKRFGRDVWEAVFEPDIDATIARLAGELSHFEQQAEHRRAMLRQAEGRMARGQGGVGPAEGQAAVGRRGR
jgi:hypothetical protein